MIKNIKRKIETSKTSNRVDKNKYKTAQRRRGEKEEKEDKEDKEEEEEEKGRIWRSREGDEEEERKREGTALSPTWDRTWASMDPNFINNSCKHQGSRLGTLAHNLKVEPESIM